MATIEPALDDLKQALHKNEFIFHYQPKVSFVTGKITGVEALIRWQKDNNTLVPPGAFIPLAESTGYITEITIGMFPRLIADLKHLRCNDSDCHLAFNISAKDLGTPRLLRKIREAISFGDMESRDLQLEITEAAIMAEKDTIAESLTGFIAADIHLAMDDYGTGYSSLETLSKLPFSVLKLDQSFISKVVRADKDETLVKTSIAMAHILGIRTVAEGIETERVYNSLLHSGCTEAQGFWISKPLPLPKYVDLEKTNKNWRASAAGLLRMAQLNHLWQHKLLLDQVFAVVVDTDAHMKEISALHLGHTQCGFGKWYYGIGQCLRGQRDFDMLEVPHRTMHDICAQILDAQEKGKDRAILVKLLDKLCNCSCVVFSGLQRLENFVIGQELKENAK